MTRGTSKFRQREVTRSIKAAKAAGVMVDRVEIDPISGKIVVHLGNGDDIPKCNSADAVMERLKNERKS